MAAQFGFGAGQLYATPLIDANGNSITNPTPIRLGAFQEGGFDFSYEIKTLYGQSQFPIAQGRAKGKAEIKTKFAQLSAYAINTLFFGQTVSTGMRNVRRDTTGSAIPTTPFQITITPPNSGTYLRDLGVVDASTGNPMTRGATATGTGVYAVNTGTGVYTFHSADTGKTVYIDYVYTLSGTGYNIPINNLLMGQIPSFSVDLYVPYLGNTLVIHGYNCIGTKMTMQTKLDDFMVPDFDIALMDDGTGKVCRIDMTGA